jgi:hypothetical protein
MEMKFMRPITVLTLLTLLILSGCDVGSGNSSSPAGTTRSTDRSSNSNSASVGNTGSVGNAGAEGGAGRSPEYRPATLAQNNTNSSQPPSATNIQRRVIRRGEFTIESESPVDGARRISQIAETRGGYVVTSETQQTGDNERQASTTATITVRVPSEQFAAAIEEIRAGLGRIQRENITGQDVTEEYTDLESRIRAKQALEEQLMGIMRQARSISDALEVQEQLGEVRAEIEQMEGRRRLLENQAALSTIVVTLQTPGSIVNTSGFFYNFRQAISDGMEFASAVFFALVRLALALLPVALFIGLPIVLLVRYLTRRAGRQRLAAELRNDARTEPK